jgi:hypothetical protein
MGSTPLDLDLDRLLPPVTTPVRRSSHDDDAATMTIQPSR